MTSQNTAQIEQPQAKPKADLVLNSRAELRDLLIQAGLARGAAEKLSRGGWPALAGEITETDLAEDCAAMARTLAEILETEK